LNAPGARPYTGRVRAWAAVCVLVPAALASASEYRIPAPGVSRIEAPSVIRQGNWEVTVSFDPAMCEISCVYRLRGDRYGRTPVADILLPPALDIRVFPEGISAPSTVTIDPARTRGPAAASDERPVPENAALPGARQSAKPSSTPIASQVAVAPPPHQERAAARVVPLSLRV
jgi:hypothetical protein